MERLWIQPQSEEPKLPRPKVFFAGTSRLRSWHVFFCPSTLPTFPEASLRSLPRSTSPAPSLGTNLLDSTGILTCLPSTTPVGLVLGPDSPSMDEPCEGTLRFSGHWILTNVCVTQADILTSALSTTPSGIASPLGGTLPYLVIAITASAGRLVPFIFGARTLDQ